MVAPRGLTTGLLWLSCLAVFPYASTAGAENILAQISVPSRHLPHRYYGQVYQFPESVRDYTDQSLFGYSFRQDLPNGAVRELQIGRLHSRGAYLLATDLFANGRFSTMSHTVLMTFPRIPVTAPIYRLEEDLSGDLRVTVPDGSVLLIDGRTGALLPTRDFALAPQGKPGTPPDLRYRGFHLRIHSTGRNPFLRGNPVTVADASGWTCRLSTEDVFRYESGPESDVFRFDEDTDLFSYLSRRCPSLRLPWPARRFDGEQSLATAAPVPILLPASASSGVTPIRRNGLEPSPHGGGGALPFLWNLFSH